MASTYQSRVAAAEERLRGLLTDALAAMARERLNGMSNEERRSFLTVRVEDLQAHCHNQEWLTLLDDAMRFTTNTKAWFYLLCPECKRAFLEDEHFLSHVEEEHAQELESLLSNVPKSVPDKQTGFLESWISPESQAHPDDMIKRKIRDAVLHLNDRKAISVMLVDKLVEYTNSWLGKSAAVPKDLRCIASLDHTGLQVVGNHLKRLQTYSQDWPRERTFGAEHDSLADDVVIQIQDACVISVDIDKTVSERDADPSNADLLFNWLYLQEERLPSWVSIRKGCITRGTEVLEKLDKMKDLLMKQVNMKFSISSRNENYFRTEALVDVEIFRIHAEVNNLKRDLVNACRFNYDTLILPVIKAHLRTEINNGSPGKGLNGVDDTGSNVMLNGDTPGNGKDSSEVDDRGGEEEHENTDNLEALHEDNDELELLSEDHNITATISKSDQQIELSPTAREQGNLEDAEQTSMASQDTSNFDSHTKDQAIIGEKANVASSSDFSVSTMGAANISTDEGNITACQNGDIELQSLNMTFRSLWHLRHFSHWYKKTAPVFPHYGVVGNFCVLCKLHQLFSAWNRKDDIRPTFVLRYMRTSFSKIFNDAKVPQKEEKNIGVKITEIIIDMIHLSQNAPPASCPRDMRYQPTMTTSSCADEKCTIHNLFGMRKNEENKYTCFVNLDASELLNVEMKSFSEVIKAVSKRFNSDTESSGYSHPPRFFTTVCRQPSDKESHFDVSGLLVSIAAPLDISSFCEGLHSEYKYTVLSAVFRAEDRDVCFAREQDKWLIYDGNTVKDADSWENVIGGYSQSRLYPKMIFFEQNSPTTV